MAHKRFALIFETDFAISRSSDDPTLRDINVHPSDGIRLVEPPMGVVYWGRRGMGRPREAGGADCRWITGHHRRGPIHGLCQNVRLRQLHRINYQQRVDPHCRALRRRRRWVGRLFGSWLLSYAFFLDLIMRWCKISQKPIRRLRKRDEFFEWETWDFCCL